MLAHGMNPSEAVCPSPTRMQPNSNSGHYDRYWTLIYSGTTDELGPFITYSCWYVNLTSTKSIFGSNFVPFTRSSCRFLRTIVFRPAQLFTRVKRCTLSYSFLFFTLHHMSGMYHCLYILFVSTYDRSPFQNLNHCFALRAPKTSKCASVIPPTKQKKVWHNTDSCCNEASACHSCALPGI